MTPTSTTSVVLDHKHRGSRRSLTISHVHPLNLSSPILSLLSHLQHSPPLPPLHRQSSHRHTVPPHSRDAGEGRGTEAMRTLLLRLRGVGRASPAADVWFAEEGGRGSGHAREEGRRREGLGPGNVFMGDERESRRVQRSGFRPFSMLCCGAGLAGSGR